MPQRVSWLGTSTPHRSSLAFTVKLTGLYRATYELKGGKGTRGLPIDPFVTVRDNSVLSLYL